MKILHIHAHFDDFEFVAAGTFELWRRKQDDPLQSRVIVCTDGKAGHHFRTREETGSIRLREQRAAAAIGGWEFAPLLDHEGNPFREGCVGMDARFLGALWKAIRDFEPDYLFCPPLPGDPLAGIHPDHVTVAEGVRRVAYLINVPHAFTPEYPADETESRPCTVPVILNVHDDYMSGANAFDLAVQAEAAFDTIVRTSWCHQSQIKEWLPWVDRHHLTPPESIEDWEMQVRALCERRNREMGVPLADAIEYFRVTAWGRIPDVDRLLSDFPPVLEPEATRRRLDERLSRWPR